MEKSNILNIIGSRYKLPFFKKSLKILEVIQVGNLKTNQKFMIRGIQINEETGEIEKGIFYFNFRGISIFVEGSTFNKCGRVISTVEFYNREARYGIRKGGEILINGECRVKYQNKKCSILKKSSLYL